MYASSDLGKSTIKKNRDKPERKAKRLVTAKKWRDSPGGKAIIKKVNAKPMNMMARSMNMMVKNKSASPVSIPSLGSFLSNNDVRVHLRKQFDGWMSWDNHGMHCAGDGRGMHWNIGHKVPKAAYDPANQNDMKNCWCPENIFPQDAFDNVSDGAKEPDAQLLDQLRHLWPEWWNGKVPEPWKLHAASAS